MKLHYSRAAPSQALQLQSSFERLKTLQVVPHASCSQSLHVSLLRDQWRKPVLSPQHDVKQSERKNVCCQASSNALELGTNNGNASEGAQNGIENIQRGNSGLQAVIKAAGIIALFCIWLKISWSRPGSLFGSVAASQPGKTILNYYCIEQWTRHNSLSLFLIYMHLPFMSCMDLSSMSCILIGDIMIILFT